MCTLEASVRTMLCFFKLTLCPLPTQFRYIIALVYIFSFHFAQDLPPILTLHAVCVPCPQPISPARASTGDHPPTCAGDGRPRNIHRPCLRRKRDRRPWGSPTREKRRAPNRPQRSGVRAVDTAQPVGGLGPQDVFTDPRGHSPGRP